MGGGRTLIAFSFSIYNQYTYSSIDPPVCINITSDVRQISSISILYDHLWGYFLTTLLHFWQSTHSYSLLFHFAFRSFSHILFCNSGCSCLKFISTLLPLWGRNITIFSEIYSLITTIGLQLWWAKKKRPLYFRLQPTSHKFHIPRHLTNTTFDRVNENESRTTTHKEAFIVINFLYKIPSKVKCKKLAKESCKKKMPLVYPQPKIIFRTHKTRKIRIVNEEEWLPRKWQEKINFLLS